MVKCVCISFGLSGFVTKTQSFLLDGHYRTDIINGVGHLRLDLVMPLVLRIVCCAMAGVRTLYYSSLGIALTLLRRGNILGRLYC
jgi:hypothetical protein